MNSTRVPMLVLLVGLSIPLAGPVVAEAVDYQAYTDLLKRTVDKDAGVDYLTILEHRGVLDGFLSRMAATDPNTLDSREARLAYWINLYNALTLQSVIDHWPVKSVLEDFPGNAFFEQWKHPTEKGQLTLNQIENEVIRKQFQDPRAHAALNCASKSCPPLMPGAYTPESLDRQLNAVASNWINDPTRNRFDVQNGKALLSPIFEWYAEDFKSVGGPLGFAAKYHPEGSSKAFAKLTLSYSKYDWSLNAR